MALMGNASINGGFSIATFDFQSTQTDTQNKKKHQFARTDLLNAVATRAHRHLSSHDRPKKRITGGHLKIHNLMPTVVRIHLYSTAFTKNLWQTGANNHVCALF